MRKVGFIGAYDKTDLIMYAAKMLELSRKRVLVIDTTQTQKSKYIVPVINPTVSYVTEFEGIDIAIGFEHIDGIKEYLGIKENEELEYDYILINIDSTKELEKFDVKRAYKNYFVTSFDMYSIKKGLEIVNNLNETLKLTKILFAKEILKEDDEYLNFLALDSKVSWNEYIYYFPLEIGDESAIAENQRVSKIKFSNLSSQYRESLTYIAEELLDGESIKNLKKALKEAE